MSSPRVTYVLCDKVGGVTTIIDNLLRFRRPDQLHHQAVLTFNCHDRETRFSGALAADSQITFEHALPVENIHAVARRLLSTIGRDPGVLVCNDALELMHAGETLMFSSDYPHWDTDDPRVIMRTRVPEHLRKAIAQDVALECFGKRLGL